MTARFLAAADASTNGLSGVFVWSGVLIAAVLVAFAGYSYLRRWMRQADDPDAGRGFTLSDLRDLHRQGKMTDEEFQATRAQLVGAAKRMADGMPPVLPRPSTRRPPGDESPPPDVEPDPPAG